MRILWIGILSLLIGCGGSTQSNPETTTTPTSDPGTAPAEQPADAIMRQHFADVGLARDAIISGDLETVRPALQRVAEAEYGDDLPAGWAAWVEHMQEQARTATQTTTLAEGGQAVAALARTCGECHQTTNAGPSLPAEVQAPAVEGMLLHAFGTEQLWLGLTAANRATWMRGASIIAENEAGGAEMEALRALARRALEAAHPAERAEIYGNLIAECASCHAAHQ